MAELLKDVDSLIQRFEQVDAVLAKKMEEAIKDGAGKAFLSAKINFSSVIEEEIDKLTEAGRYSSSKIGNQLNDVARLVVTVNEALDYKVRRFIALLAFFAFLAGCIGGFVGAKLAGM